MIWIYHDFVNNKLEKRKALQLDAGKNNSFESLNKNRLDVIIMMCAYYLNGDKNKRCAFCKYWYDPTNQYIRPQNPKNGIWKFETTARCVCLKTNLEMGAGMQCSKFENKIV